MAHHQLSLPSASTWRNRTPRWSAGMDGSVVPSSKTAAMSEKAAFRRLLVPVDGTPFGERALPIAASIAARSNAELRLVHVERPRNADRGLSGYYRPCSQSGAYLERLAHNVAEASGIEVRAERLVRQDIIDGISEAAGQGVDLVIAATHRYGWLASAWYGETFPRLLSRLSAPMLVLPADSQQVALADRWLRKLLVSLDVPSQTEQVMRTAVRLGSLYGASYSLLSVVPYERLEDRARSPGSVRRYLRQVAERHAPHAERHTVVTDSARAEVIAAHADEHFMDCIAIAHADSQARTALPAVGASRRLVRLSPAPVLLLPSDAA